MAYRLEGRKVRPQGRAELVRAFLVVAPQEARSAARPTWHGFWNWG